MSAQCPERREDLSPAARELAALLPGLYLARNESLPGRPLLCLLEVLAAPLDELAQAIERLEDDRFVERASAEALPLLAELVGARLLGDDARANRGVLARTLHWRRRKGTLHTLEEALGAASGWSAEVEESFRSLLHNQDLANPVPWRGRNAVLWDPIALSDPLSRRAAPVRRPRAGAIERSPTLAMLPGEDVTATLRRLGRADAGRHAASPRTLDLLGWARPEIAVVRTARCVHRERDRSVLGPALAVVSSRDPARLAGYTLDPRGRPQPMVWRHRLAPAAATGGLTAAHEPDSAPPALEWRYSLLTPTALAADPDGVEADDNLGLWVDGVQLIGPPAAAQAGGDLPFEPLGTRAVLRLADSFRPSPGDEWLLDLVALDNPDALASPAQAGAEPDPAPADENPRLLHALVHRGSSAVQTSAVAGLPRAGATLALRVMRGALDLGYNRAADGTWSRIQVPAGRGQALSHLVALDAGGQEVFARLVRLPGAGSAPGEGLAVATWRAGEAQWTLTALDLGTLDPDRLPVLDGARPGPAIPVLADGERLYLAAPAGQGGSLGLWRIDGAPAGAPDIERLDQGGGPPTRLTPALAMQGDELILLGGERDGHTLGDLWTLALAGADAGRWRARRVRRGQARAGAVLLAGPAGLVLLGGAETLGALSRRACRLDLARPRPVWEDLPELPIAPDGPGVLWARTAGGAIEALVWADSTAPRRLSLEPGAADWQSADPETAGAPNPPADGDALFAGGRFVCLAPPPLPASEVVFASGGEGRLAFLPALDPVRADEALLFLLERDGGTRPWVPPGTVLGRGSLRLAAGRHVSDEGRRPPAPRVGVPGRLAWAPLRLRQLSLAHWDRPLDLELADRVGLDPRLGRILLHPGLAAGEVRASYRVAASAALGADFLPESREPPDDWREPDDPAQPKRFAVPPTPERDTARVGGAARAAAVVDPPRAGGTDAYGARRVANLADALAAVSAPEHAVAVRGSPRLPPADLALGEREVLSLFRESGGDWPFIAAAGGVSLTLRRRLDARTGPGPVPGTDAGPGPRCYLCGIALAGALEAAFPAGELDLRWCDAGGPGLAGLRVAGAGHQSALALRSLPRATVQVRLYGCRLGPLVLPPWVQLVAAGCLIDAGDPGSPAILAPGARLRLRHCTVHGGVQAGLLEASSCAFKGPVECTRPDLGWLRYSLLESGGRPPVAFDCRTQPISFVSVAPADPDYLALDSNNGDAALERGERGRLPGAHGEHSARLAELTERTADLLPLGLVARHEDRTRVELDRMYRRAI